MVEIYVLSVVWATDSEVTTPQVVESSDGPITDYDHPDDHAPLTYEMTPGFKQFTDQSLFSIQAKYFQPAIHLKQADYDLLAVTMLVVINVSFRQSVRFSASQ